MWCLTSPPPRMIMPVFLARTAWLLMLRMSATKCTFNHTTDRWRPVDQFHWRGWIDGFTFHDVENEARVLVRVEVEHVAEGAISQSGTEHWNVVLTERRVFRNNDAK